MNFDDIITLKFEKQNKENKSLRDKIFEYEMPDQLKSNDEFQMVSFEKDAKNPIQKKKKKSLNSSIFLILLFLILSTNSTNSPTLLRHILALLVDAKNLARQTKKKTY